MTMSKIITQSKYISPCLLLLSTWCINCISSKHFLYTDLKKDKIVSINTKGLYFGKLDTFPTQMRRSGPADKIEINCAFASIPGAFFGRWVEPFFGYYQIKDSDISISMAPNIFDNRLQIAPVNTINPEPVTALTIMPPETKFARIGTVCETYPSGITSETGIELLFMYFDRPAKIEGRLTSKFGSLEIDLEIPAAGFYFIEKEPRGKENAVINKIHNQTDAYYLLMER